MYIQGQEGGEDVAWTEQHNRVATPDLTELLEDALQGLFFAVE